jgi:hypothetical protein
MKKLLTILTFAVILTTAQNVSAQALTNKVVVAWNAVTEYVGGSLIESTNTVKYNIWRAESASLTSPVKLNGTNIVTTLQFQDPAPQYNKVYWYFVTAYIVDGIESENSESVKLNTNKPKAPVIKLLINN